MRAGPLLEDIGKWDEIKPLIDYGKNGRFNMRSVKLFMDGNFEKRLSAAGADDSQVLLDLGVPPCWHHIRITTRLQAC